MASPSLATVTLTQLPDQAHGSDHRGLRTRRNRPSDPAGRWPDHQYLLDCRLRRRRTFSKGVYATAKAAVIGMCHGGAKELGPYGITVNVLAPGPIDTEIMGGQLIDEGKAAMSFRIPMGRVGQPSEIAATIAFLLSAGAGSVNGATIQLTAESTCTERARMR
jgi:NAD(P)-dependent dehydrogenase (short-subunit alcohol dehydrogenase family)